MKKREIIGIILLVISIFILLLNIMINIYIGQGEKDKGPEKSASLIKNIFLSFERQEGENLNGTG